MSDEPSIHPMLLKPKRGPTALEQAIHQTRDKGVEARLALIERALIEQAALIGELEREAHVHDDD